MDEVDMENEEDLNELEARLYAQIHHEPSGGDIDASTAYEEVLPVRQVTTNSVINTSIDKTRGRYWNEKLNFRNNRNPVPPRPKTLTADEEQLNKEKQSGSTKSGEIRDKPVETIDKTFQPPVKNLSNLRVNPFASGNDPKKKGSTTQPRGKNTKPTDQFKRLEIKETNKGLFGRQQNKLANALKYDGKKQKAKAAKAKMKKNQGVRTIELLSESDNDDVIEVSVPSPEIVSIDTSSDEETAEPVNKEKETKVESFVKPEAIAAKENTSRCTSPCSVISDDFIGHHDRSRLLEESEKADDEDLLMLEIDVDSLMETPEKSTEIEAPHSFAKPTESGSAKTSSDYIVTQSEFRALDVYESESDIQDSVYSKGSKRAKPSVVVNLEQESCSSDDVEEIVITQKTKRLRKRRTSSGNKEIDIDTTDSEPDNDSDCQRTHEVQLTKIPYIAYGEAVETMISSDIHNEKVVNMSDNEFIANLNTLAQGAPPSTVLPTENDSDDEEIESITARSIAESVLNKNRASEKTTTKRTKTVIPEPVIAHNEEANDAIPHDSLVKLNHIFSKIDNMDKKKSPDIVDSNNDTDESVELVSPLPASITNRPSHRKLKMQKETGDPVYNVVYSEGTKIQGGGGIGWSEEMRKFYNDSWKGERFSVKAVCAQMKPTKTLWKIYTDDRFPKYRKYSHQKCMNCCEFGHIRSKCPRPRKLPVCYMCGEQGHSEPRCPNTICLRCGNKTRMYTKSCNACNYQNRLICPICKMRGHNLNLCPDKWRRYHSTTKPNQYPNNKVEYKNKKLCCICGLRGHLAEHCRSSIQFSEYPMFVSEIKSHQKSYDDISIKTIRSGIGYNLMYKPDEDISFELAENKSRKQYYGRFLLAVGMEYLLTRKRRIEQQEDTGSAAKQKKLNNELKEYVVNPFAKAALEKSPAKPSSRKQNDSEQPIDVDVEEQTNKGDEESPSKEQPAVSEPLNIDEEDTYSIEPSTSKGIVQTSREDIIPQKNKSSSNSGDRNVANKFKTPTSTSPGTLCKKNTEAVDIVDSDSNYSFSEHFEPNEQQSNPPNAREMGPLPDFIPIFDDEDIEEEEPEQLISAGISKKFVSNQSDEEDGNTNELPDLPCEAKIYLTTFHSKFLLSPDGNSFLIEKSKSFDIKARLEWTSVGHILIIYGLRCNQDKFHIELLHKFRELSEKMNRNQLEKSQKVPRKTEVLIRFLRENLNQLLTNLGNPNELFKRLTYQEKQQTKTGWKSAEKTRRLLNMILIGQAGLLNGSVHLDHLLSHLRVLINEWKDEAVSDEVRDEIDSHWRLIFSSHRHEKYSELVTAYNHMQIKNRFQNINIDPRLLGKKVLDTSLTKVQKDRMDKAADVNTLSVVAGLEKTQSPAKLVPNPLSMRITKKSPKTPVSEKKRPKNVPLDKQKPLSNPSNQQATANQKEVNQSYVAEKIKAVNVEWEAKCANLLTEIDETGNEEKGGRPILNSKAGSMFWSREALKYIDECMQLASSNAGFMEKLSRVQNKSQKGLLSYNDYRAIIKIHNAIKSKH